MDLGKKKKVIISILIIFLISFIIYFSGIIKRSCDSDPCFDAALKECSPVKFKTVRNNNLYQYVISRSLGSKCKITIEIIKMAEGTEPDLRYSLEGKSMKCYIPKSQLATTNLDKMKDLLSYCTGPLKEGLYESMLKKVYSLVVTQMKDIIEKAEGVLGKV